MARRALVVAVVVGVVLQVKRRCCLHYTVVGETHGMTLVDLTKARWLVWQQQREAVWQGTSTTH